MRVGLPILANTALFGAVLNLDRVLILWRVADGARAAGLYSIAIMGTSWSLDVAGRIVLVMYTAFQTTLGRAWQRHRLQVLVAGEAGDAGDVGLDRLGLEPVEGHVVDHALPQGSHGQLLS